MAIIMYNVIISTFPVYPNVKNVRLNLFIQKNNMSCMG